MRKRSLYRTLLGTAFMLSIAALSASAQSKIEVVGGDTYNWGVVAPGDLKATIVVKNVGSDVLTISSVRPSCGCTTSPIDRNRLEPGESGNISVTLRASGSGPVHKVITINSDAPGDTVHMVQLTADIHPQITFEPANYFLVNDATVGKVEERSVTIVNSGTERLTIYRPELVTANAKVEFSMTKQVELAPGGRLELKARITPGAVGAITGDVKVRTSSKENPEVKLAIYGVAAAVAPPVVIDTPALSNRRK